MLFLKSVAWSILEISILQAVLNLTQFVFEIPSGYIADHFGRKTTIALGELLIIFYSFSFLFASTQHWIVYVGFFLYGLGLSLISGADHSLIYDDISSDKYVDILGKYNAINILAIALRTVAGGVIPGFSWPLVFISTAITQTIALFFILRINERPPAAIEQETGLGFFNEILKYVKKHPRIIYLVLVISLTQAGISILYQYSSLLFNHYGLPASIISLIFLGSQLLGAFVSVRIESITIKYGISKLITRLFIIGLFSFLILISDNIYASLLYFFAVNALFEVWDLALNIEFQDTVPSKTRTTMFSMVNQFTALLMALESILVGILTSYWSIKLTFMLVGLFSLGIGLILYLRYIKAEPSD